MRDIKELLRDLLKYAIVIVIVLLLILYVVSLQQVIGPSMNPNYQSGDVLILNKLQYRVGKPKRFEVAAIQNQDTKYFIKRVIGLPNEHIAYKDGILYVNGKVLEEPFSVAEETPDFDLISLGYETIPEGYYLVLGDNRTNSLDSRSKEVGLMKEEDFIGKVAFRIWPLFRK